MSAKDYPLVWVWKVPSTNVTVFMWPFYRQMLMYSCLPLIFLCLSCSWLCFFILASIGLSMPYRLTNKKPYYCIQKCCRFITIYNDLCKFLQFIFIQLIQNVNDYSLRWQALFKDNTLFDFALGGFLNSANMCYLFDYSTTNRHFRPGTI